MSETLNYKEELEDKVIFYAAALQNYPKDIHGVVLSEVMETEEYQIDWKNYLKYYDQLETLKEIS